MYEQLLLVDGTPMVDGIDAKYVFNNLSGIALCYHIILYLDAGMWII